MNITSTYFIIASLTAAINAGSIRDFAPIQGNKKWIYEVLYDEWYLSPFSGGESKANRDSSIWTFEISKTEKQDSKTLVIMNVSIDRHFQDPFKKDTSLQNGTQNYVDTIVSIGDTIIQRASSLFTNPYGFMPRFTPYPWSKSLDGNSMKIIDSNFISPGKYLVEPIEMQTDPGTKTTSSYGFFFQDLGLFAQDIGMVSRNFRGEFTAQVSQGTRRWNAKVKLIKFGNLTLNLNKGKARYKVIIHSGFGYKKNKVYLIHNQQSFLINGHQK